MRPGHNGRSSSSSPGEGGAGIPPHKGGFPPGLRRAGRWVRAGSAGLVGGLLWAGCGGDARPRDSAAANEAGGGARLSEPTGSREPPALQGSPSEPPPLPAPADAVIPEDLETFLADYRRLVEEYCAYAARFPAASPREINELARELTPLARRLSESTNQARKLQGTAPLEVREELDSLHARAAACADKFGN